MRDRGDGVGFQSKEDSCVEKAATLMPNFFCVLKEFYGIFDEDFNKFSLS